MADERYAVVPIVKRSFDIRDNERGMLRGFGFKSKKIAQAFAEALNEQDAHFSALQKQDARRTYRSDR